MDLSLNQLPSWKIVAQIVSFATSLSELVLTSNPLVAIAPQDVSTIGNTFHCLSSIVLGNLAYSWDDVCQCALLWPNIKRLNLFNNDILHLSQMQNILQNLTFLSLSSNRVSDWNEVCKLGTLSK